MITGPHHVTVLVRDQDHALRFYVDILGFEKIADDSFGPGMRWLVVAPKGQAQPHIVLNKAFDPDMETRIGKLSGWVFHTEDCQATYADLLAKGVKFTEKPTTHIWGIQALFEDLYGNQFVLLQPTA
jgi:catechol 2,3-dioxygenase-like lactoylglutathione lyase family enzyme